VAQITSGRASGRLGFPVGLDAAHDAELPHRQMGFLDALQAGVVEHAIPQRGLAAQAVVREQPLQGVGHLVGHHRGAHVIAGRDHHAELGQREAPGNIGEEVGELDAVERQGHRAHEPAADLLDPVGLSGRQFGAQALIGGDPRRNHLVERRQRGRVAAGERQDGGEVVFQSRLGAVAGGAGRDLRKPVALVEREELPREHVVGRGRRPGRRAVGAGLTPVALARHQSAASDAASDIWTAPLSARRRSRARSWVKRPDRGGPSSSRR
jgi:hypothetical protein